MNHIHPIAQYSVESDPNWLFCSGIDSEYSVEISIINKNIVHLDVKGYTTDSNRYEIWPKVVEIINTKIEGNYYLVHNYKNFKGGNSKARHYYINWIFENINTIDGVYFYNCSPYHKILIKTGQLFSPKLRNTFILNSYEEVINDIVEKSEIKSAEKVNPFWSKNEPYISKSLKQYKISKYWSHNPKEDDSKYETFLINDNIIIRHFYGKFGDNAMNHISESLDKILKEVGLYSSRYHFYIDYKYVEEMTLGFRKAGLSWFIDKRHNLITGGFYNINPLFKIQIKIARSFSPYISLRNKVNIVNKFEEAISLIETFGSETKDNEIDIRSAYKRHSKKNLIKEIEALKKEVQKLEKERTDHIKTTYNQLGRVSWDETFEFTDKEIDSSDNPYADINNAILLIQRDIKEILDKRDELIYNAKEADRLKTSFLANMSHEIRTPMNSILGFSSILLEELKKEEHLKFVQLITNSGNHLLKIINDILDISKIQSGNFQLFFSVCNVKELIEGVIQELSPFNKNKLKVVFEENQELLINCDTTRLKQVFTNLLSNAYKFTKEGSINIGYKQVRNEIIFHIQDTGKGISPEGQKIIFDRFRQVDDAITREFEGTGLGLSITKSFIELHGGKIWLESTLNEGSTFYFSLPYKSVSNGNVKIISRPNIKFGIKDKTILIAEDNMENFMYIDALLNKNNNKIIHTKSGVETLKEFKNQKVDLILMDIQMPDMDGLTCTKLIRDKNTEIPIIAQTAYAMPDDIRKSREAGCNFHISKPIKKNELYSILNNLF